MVIGFGETSCILYLPYFPICLLLNSVDFIIRIGNSIRYGEVGGIGFCLVLSLF